jgi:hypothetical protein
MISFVIIKPQFIYDHSKKKYKEFALGSSGDKEKSMLSLPVLAVIIAVIIGIIFCNVGQNSNKTNDSKVIRYEYVKVPMISPNYLPYYYPEKQ